MKKSVLSRFIFTAVITASVSFTLMPPTQAKDAPFFADTKVHQWDIGRQPLAWAISELAYRGGYAAKIPAELGDKKLSRVITGEYTVSYALSRLLRGTGYTFKLIGERELQIEAISLQKPTQSWTSIKPYQLRSQLSDGTSGM